MPRWLPRMSFADLRIKNDVDMLMVPLRHCQLNGRAFRFTVDIHTALYNGAYDFELVFPDGYPFMSPRLTCLTPVYHPNIGSEGHVCLKVLREGWMPSYDLNSIVVSLLCAFHYLSADDALNTEAASLLENDYEEFERRVKSTGRQDAEE